jgi:hypothetical protein
MSFSEAMARFSRVTDVEVKAAELREREAKKSRARRDSNDVVPNENEAAHKDRPEKGELT